jgi:hypothetical protein
MNVKTAKSLKSAHIALILLLSLPSLIFPAMAYDFTGTVEKVSEPNSMTVNVTQPGTYGLQAKVEVLLDKPLADLIYFKGKELQFDILGRDILGRPVCEAYLNGISIRQAYYRIQNPADFSYNRNRPAWEWAGEYYGEYNGGYYGDYYYVPCYNGQCGSYYPSFYLPTP